MSGPTTTQPSPAPSTKAPAIQLPFTLPWVPAGEDPQTSDIDRVHGLMKSAAYFTVFNGPNFATPNIAHELIPGLPLYITSVEVNEQLHRCEMQAGYSGDQIRAARRVGEAIGTVRIHWHPIPNYYEASPDCEPPAWVFNPTVQQRYCMLGGQLNLNDKDHTGAHNFGCGHTFPANEGGKLRMRVGAVIDMLVGRGQWEGVRGMCTINGYIEPPTALALTLMIRIVDPEGKFLPVDPIPPMQAIADPDPDAVTVMFLGEVDPSEGVHIIPAKDGKSMSGSHVNELLRLVSIQSDITGPSGLRTVTKEGPVVGKLKARLHFNPLSPAKMVPIQTTDGVFEFWDKRGNTIGTINANMVEGRGIRTQVEGFPMPFYRFGGFGPIISGTGQFEGADGLMTLNATICVFPRTLSNMYYFRFYDPQGKIRRAWAEMADWSW